MVISETLVNGVVSSTPEIVEELARRERQGPALSETSEDVDLRVLCIDEDADLGRGALREDLTEQPQGSEACDRELRELPLRFGPEHGEAWIVVREEIEVAGGARGHGYAAEARNADVILKPWAPWNASRGWPKPGGRKGSAFVDDQPVASQRT